MLTLLAGTLGAPPETHAPLSFVDLSSNSFAVYADATSSVQVDELSHLRERASDAGVTVKLGHIYGHGLS